MTRTDAEIVRAIDRCISLHIPFAYVVMPGDADGCFFASLTAEATTRENQGAKFIIRNFGIDHTTPPITIVPDMSIADINDLELDGTTLNQPTVVPVIDGTTYQEYLDGCNEIISSLKRAGGKTVYSRVIAIESESKFTDVLDQYFSRYPDTMRFVYYTPMTGLWFGATPELLLDYSTATGEIDTMSLAGTRGIDKSKRAWDEKNITEHQYVTDYIIDTFRSLGIEARVYDTAPLRFGIIEHLCDRIRGRGDIDPVVLADVMSPTPALCGWPKRIAYEQIVRTERHHRHCYGGWIAVAEPGRFRAYVNLRSALAAPSESGMLYNLYAGGGITAQSVAEEEWMETEKKSAVLREIISGVRL